MVWVLIGVVFGTNFSILIFFEWISKRARLSEWQGIFVWSVLVVLNALLLFSIFDPIVANGDYRLGRLIAYSSMLGWAVGRLLNHKRLQTGAEWFKRRDQQQKQVRRRHHSDDNR